MLLAEEVLSKGLEILVLSNETGLDESIVDGVRDECPIREVTWAFVIEGEMQVGVYAARPTHAGEDDGEHLDVALKDFVIEKRKN